MSVRREWLTGDDVVDVHLAPLLEVVGTRGAMEVVAVRAGELVVEVEGVGWKAVPFRIGTLEWWRRVGTVLANFRGLVFDGEAAPQLSTVLPGGHRLELLMGTAVVEGLAVAIRVRRKVDMPLSAFGLSGQALELVEDGFRRRTNMLVSGGTATGKTTLFRAGLRLVPASDRVVSVEDAAELDLPHVPNWSAVIMDRRGTTGLSPAGVFDFIVRARADRVLAGEVSMTNAPAVLALLSTGHRGFVATLHADSAREVMETAFPDRLALAGRSVDAVGLRAYLRRVVDLVVQIGWHEGRRQVVELWRPGIEDEPWNLVQGARHGTE